MLTTNPVLKDEHLQKPLSSYPYGQVLSSDAAETIALQIAHHGSGFVSPNPLVGAVLVDAANRLIGLGAHLKVGEGHAEVNALADARARGFTEQIAGSTLYCTLEPCAHQGRTPSCAALLSTLKIATVSIGCLDPNPQVNGKGLAMLKEAGCRIMRFSEPGQRESSKLAEVFFHGVRHTLPYVGMKVATSLNGVMAKRGDQRRWLTSERARQYVHFLRLRYDAVLIGAETLIEDDPTLDVRAAFPKTRIPERVILDPQLRGYAKRPEASILKQEPERTTWLCTPDADPALQAALRAKGARVLTSALESDKRFNTERILENLKQLGIQSVLLEGGAGIYANFLRDDLVNRLHCFSALRLRGSTLDVFWGTGFGEEMDKCLQDVEITLIEQEILIEGLLRNA